jgi:creatinine amidohydrolase
LPAVGYAVTEYAAAFPGALGITPLTLESLITDICRSVKSQGFGQMVIVNSHFEPAHVAALRRVADSQGVVLFDLTRRRNAEQLTEEFRSGAAHAGRYETSLVLAERPDLVDQYAMSQLPPLAVNMPREMADGKMDFRAMGMTQAYCGAPAEASADEGASTFSTLTTMLVSLVQSL